MSGTSPFSIYQIARQAILSGLQTATDTQAIFATVSTFLANLDDNLNRFANANQLNLACQAGCHYCCHFRVEARAHEIFLLCRHIEQLALPRRMAFMTRLEQTQSRAAQLGATEHLTTNLRCSLLEADNTCACYTARPALCRNAHSNNADYCQMSFVDPKRSDIPNGRDQALDQATRSAILGMNDGFKSAGFDDSAYELNQALWQALTDSQAIVRWINKQQVFPGLASVKIAPPAPSI